METSMAKRLSKVAEGSANLAKRERKGVSMTIQQQVRSMLWEAFPFREHDTRGSWFNWIASSSEGRSVGWKPRRVRALFRCEARVVTAEEWKLLNERLNAAKEKERQLAEKAHEHRIYRGGMGESMPVSPREDLPLPLAASPSTSSAATRRSAGRPAEPHSEE
jgi:hypothetical protein